MVCPQCGAILTAPSPSTAASTSSENAADAVPTASKARLWWQRLLPLSLALLFFIVALVAAGYAGVYVGERDREEQRQATLEAHYQAGIVALNEGRFERAVSEFAYVLQLEPQNALAQQGLAEAQARLVVLPTPTSEAEQSLAEQLFEQAQAAYEDEEWSAVANTLTQLRRLDIYYRREAVEDLLFQSLYNAGQELLASENIEQGISYLDQAIALRPYEVASEVYAERNLAARYLDALGYWGVDWNDAVRAFEELYETTPYYRDVSTRLYRAYLEYGNFHFEQGEMCPAEQVYARAIRRFGDPQGTLEERHTEAAQVCLVATPAPVDGADPVLTPRPIPGFTVGRLAYPVYNSNAGTYDLFALYTDGRIIRVSSNADQPWWEWGTGRLVYRDKINGGVRMVLPEEGVPLQLLAPGGQGWPTLSPDSQRMAYSAPAEDGTWYIYIANTNGSGEPQRLARGWAPAWGRSGWLAYTGCEADGDTCGIYIDNPDDDQPPRRLTGSTEDTAVTWSPAGNMMAYMGRAAGNWDIFLLSPEGWVAQFTTDTSDEGMPVWSPDGSSLAFVSNRGGEWAIYVMTMDGQNLNRIVDLGGPLPGWENQRLSWAP